jgi:hypothetical protein
MFTALSRRTELVRAIATSVNTCASAPPFVRAVHGGVLLARSDDAESQAGETSSSSSEVTIDATTDASLMALLRASDLDKKHAEKFGTFERALGAKTETLKKYGLGTKERKRLLRASERYRTGLLKL